MRVAVAGSVRDYPVGGYDSSAQRITGNGWPPMTVWFRGAVEQVRAQTWWPGWRAASNQLPGCLAEWSLPTICARTRPLSEPGPGSEPAQHQPGEVLRY